MKKNIFTLGCILILSVLASCSSAQDESDKSKDVNGTGETESKEVSAPYKENGEKKETSIAEGTEIVIATVEKLKETVKKSPNDGAKINKFGDALQENWDIIEKQVRERYPEDYKNIEESLYPLINYAKKDTPDVKKIKPLIKATYDKLTVFKEKVSK
ncbi:hypothetical protein NC797_01590 [Aquibacillus sp. 3ASR75-11]|uniref:Lipoprotein n=1 Tax=Terrihalobacillus insolitus TaxID=2950438 RepID=A0A9X3WP15_9BACI|nr:hypothetical protein [Terrihalobacillus insolitus]MDC3412107.1 hypothetical protein [Terrihalobacillus insolitus]MDC3423200.1 hypothetical protein [Terrihalobacillus insolitus]